MTDISTASETRDEITSKLEAIQTLKHEIAKRKLSDIEATGELTAPLCIPGSKKRKRSRRLGWLSKHTLVAVGMVVATFISMATLLPLAPGLNNIPAISEFANALDPINPVSFVQHREQPQGIVYQSAPSGTFIPSFPGSTVWNTATGYYTKAGVMGTGKLQHPVNGAIITQYYGTPEYQYWCHCYQPHSGIDLAAPAGTPIHAADGGQVVWAGWDISGLGYSIKINHGRGISTIYGHASKLLVHAGDVVTQGQTIALVGSTGQSTGPHCHFMVLVNDLQINPMKEVSLP